MNAVSTYTLTTDCTCTVYDAEYGEGIVPSDECFGCFTDDRDNIAFELDRWVESEEIDAVYIKAAGIGWQHLSGVACVNATGKEILDALAINGDYRLELYLTEDGTLTARRWSHDEPTGTGLFEFEPANYCDNCGMQLECTCEDEEDN